MLSIKPRKRAGEKGGESFLDNITHRKSFNHISVRKLKNVEKCIVTMGYFNIDPCCSLIPTIENPITNRPLYLRPLPSLTTSSLINPNQVVASENIISDKSAHFTQFCIHEG